MEEFVSPQELQSIFDIAIQAYGSIEGVLDIMNDNSFDIVPKELSVYEDIKISKQPIRPDVRDYYDTRGVLPATGITQSELELLVPSVFRRGEGIGYMIINNDFIVANDTE